MNYLLWKSKSTRTLADELAGQGYAVSHVTMARCLPELGYSLQSNVNKIEGAPPPDRDAQFRYLNGQVRRFVRRHDPVVGVDMKKKEWAGFSTIAAVRGDRRAIQRRSTSTIFQP
jgi:Rhodopirellula transposase DDE domain